ncbi:hypothetical protein T484DRAFT_1877084, partial [Baffinella frigidus]
MRTSEEHKNAGRKISKWLEFKNNGGLSGMYRFIEANIQTKRDAASIVKTFLEEAERKRESTQGKMSMGWFLEEAERKRESTQGKMSMGIMTFTRSGKMSMGIMTFTRSVRIIQRCVRAFIFVRRFRREVWERQFVTFEQARNRSLMRTWRKAWAQTTREIARILKLNTTREIARILKLNVNKGPAPKKKKGPPKQTVRWVGAVLDDFIAALPEEVKNVMEVPPEVRKLILEEMKDQRLRAYMSGLENYHARVLQMASNRVFRDMLYDTFPKLANLDLQDPELHFLLDCDNEPSKPFLANTIPRTELLELVLRGQRIARGEDAMPVIVRRNIVDSAEVDAAAEAIRHTKEHKDEGPGRNQIEKLLGNSSTGGGAVMDLIHKGQDQ